MLVKNFIDLYQTDRKLADQLLEFYNQKFVAEDIPNFFVNWKYIYNPDLVLIHSNPKGWIAKLIVHDYMEYSFDESNFIYYPQKMHEFISDCLRFEDIQLEFNQSFIRKLKIKNIE